MEVSGPTERDCRQLHELSVSYSWRCAHDPHALPIFRLRLLLPTSYFLPSAYYLLLANFCPLAPSKCYRWASSPLISDRRAIGRLAPRAARCVLGYMLAPSCESFVDSCCSAGVLRV